MRKLATEDLFAGIRLFKTADMREELKTIYGNAAGKSQKQIGIEMFYAIILKCSDKAFEKAFYEFCAGPLEVKPEEVAKMDPIKLFESAYEVANPEEWLSFFERVKALNHQLN